jgi:transcriptional regulator with XRE-family HTH domain
MKPAIKTPDIIDVAIGARIRSHRLAQGVTQTKLAKTLRITIQQVQKYETGVNRVSAGRLKQIAEILEVPISLFFDDVDGNRAEAELIDLVPGFSEDVCAGSIARTFNEIRDQRVRQAIMGLVERIAGMQPSRAKSDK